MNFIMNKIVIYTDGSSKGNPGPGGWAAIIFDGKNVKEIGGREEKTTNNRMEITAVIEALRFALLAYGKQTPEIEVYTDSEYLINGITTWIKNWQKNDWRTKNKKAVLNKDLWEKLSAKTEGRNIKWEKVLGHSGHKFNDRCDEIATSFADGFNIFLYKGSKSNYDLFH